MASNFNTNFNNAGLLQPTLDPGITGATGGGIGGSFGSVLLGVSQNAERGVSPFSKTSSANLTPGQVAAQMKVGGLSSVLPMLGSSFMPKLIFPLASLWSLFQGVKSFASLKTEGASRIQNFETSNLAYNQMRAKVDGLLNEPAYGSQEPLNFNVQY